MEDQRGYTEVDLQVPELNIAKAVVEILQALISRCCPDSVDVSIKTTRGMTSLHKGSWFYVKVSVNVKIDMEVFKESSLFPHLLDILQTMQQLETESHLCLQNSVGGETCQQNIVVEGTQLVVQHEIRKQKPAVGSSLYLRLHQSPHRMMSESQIIFKVLQVIKIFRPRMFVQFNMKIGENVCRSNYRLTEWITISPDVPDIVSESAFYLHKSGYTADSDYVKASMIGPEPVSVRVEGSLETFNVTCVGIYIPVVNDSGKSSVVTLTLLGPGWFPFDVNQLKNPGLLGDLNLFKLGLKVTSSSTDNTDMSSSGLRSCHWQQTVQSTNKQVPMETFVVQLFLYMAPSTGNQDSESTGKEYYVIQKYLANVLEKANDRLCCMIRETLHKSLQTWLQKAKTRSLVYKSIRSASKAVRDIVSMSDRESFRQEVFGLLQVDNTMELEIKIQSKLTDISRRRHHGVLGGASLDSQMYKEETSSSLNQPDNQAIQHRLDMEQPTRGENDEVHTIIDSDTRQNNDSSSDQNQNTTRQERGENLLPCPTTKTPEVSGGINDVEDISPFQQLAEDLMDAVDDICQSELDGADMQEEPFGNTQIENEIMAQLFHENDGNTEDCGCNVEINNTLLKHENVNVKEVNRDDRIDAVSIPKSLKTNTKLCRPEVSALQNVSMMKRSFSFPKALENSQGRSSKFYRALSGDRLIPKSLSEITVISPKASSVEQVHFSKKSCRNYQMFDSQAESNSRNIFSDEVDFYDNHLETLERQRISSQKDKVGMRNDPAFKWDKEFKETLDVISQFVDDRVEKEITGLGSNTAWVSQTHSSCDKNTNSIGKTFAKPEDENCGEKIYDKTHVDSDDWFDETVADIEKWFS